MTKKIKKKRRRGPVFVMSTSNLYRTTSGNYMKITIKCTLIAGWAIKQS